jgi:hypothetical protein
MLLGITVMREEKLLVVWPTQLLGVLLLMKLGIRFLHGNWKLPKAIQEEHTYNKPQRDTTTWRHMNIV